VKKVIAAAMLLGCGTVHAGQITIDFNDIDDDAAYAVTYPFNGGDFLIAWSTGDGNVIHLGANFEWGHSGAGSNGTGYISPIFVSELHFKRLDDQPFNLHSLDIADVREVIGTYVNGDTITMDLTLTPRTWTTVSFGSEWSNLVRVQVNGTGLGVSTYDPDWNGYLNLDNVVITPAISADIVIDPWSWWNPTGEIQPESDKPIPVAILGQSIASGDDADLDVTQIDAASVRFGPGEATYFGVPMIQDLDSDSNPDIMLTFATQDSGIFCEDTEVGLSGEMTGGPAFVGTTAITTSDCESGGCHP